MLDSLRKDIPEKKMGMITVFPSNVSQSLARTILHDRWKIKGVAGYIDPDDELFAAYKVRGVPFSVLFDKEGNEIARYEGFPGRDALTAKLKAAVAK